MSIALLTLALVGTLALRLRGPYFAVFNAEANFGAVLSSFALSLNPPPVSGSLLRPASGAFT